MGLAKAFRPSGPVDTSDLFRGRTRQIIQVGQTLVTPGRHAVIYGERGVGKTSLAAISSELFATDTIRINCDEGDNFASLWEKVAEEVRQRSRLPDWEHGEDGRRVVFEAGEVLETDMVSPEAVRHFLRGLGSLMQVVLFIDEYDQVVEPGVGPLMANTIKAVSDHLTPATICLMGVADDVESLVASHASIERNLEEISMPRMNTDEIRDIIIGGYDAVGIAIEDDAQARIIRLPQGLPHFAHLLAQKAGEAAVLGGVERVTLDHVRMAVREAIASSEASLTQRYVEATTSTHKDTHFESVLLACALTPIDDLGYFTPGDMRGPLRKITGEYMDIDRFSRHLVLFCEKRGPILERRGGERRWRYRFINPRMRPYVIMRAIDAGYDEDLLGLAPVPTEQQLPF